MNKTFELVVGAYSQAFACEKQVFSREGCYLFEYLISDLGYLEIGGKKYHCQPDSFFIVPPETENSYWADSKAMWEKLFFICGGDLVTSLLQIYGMNDIFYINDGRAFLKYFKDMYLISKTHGYSRDKESALTFHKFLIDISEQVGENNEKKRFPEKVVKLREKLDTSVEKVFDLEKCCVSLGISKAYMIRLFKSNCGVTPYEYLLRLRVKTAELLLKHSMLTIKEISARLAFNDQYHFSNTFKKRNGISPVAFRKRNIR
ncbi:MAG: AraC family transcriptional regulator [Lentisphaerae bacterium]|nr:AraC family transcriptional regulator [Lentisphaerota bacterium]MCP4102498.1 AraC family transcriptional regulator [Lentisphaerota bacterium]